MSLDPNKTYLVWNGTKFPNSTNATFKAPARSTIDWGDGKSEEFSTETAATHTYDDGKTEHTIAISGLTSLGYRAFRECSNLMSVTIGNSVTSIGGGAFYYCSNLTSVTIPDSVTNIGYNTFQNCSNLTSVTIGNSVTSIGSYVFTSCSSLTSITIPDSVTSIDSYAFYNCSSLTSITIPNSVTNIGENAFRNCYKLIEVKNLSTLGITAGSESYGYVGYYAKRVYTEGASYLSTIDNGYIIYDDSTDKILMGYTGTETNLTLPRDITQIYERAFYNRSSLTSVTIGNGVTNIGSFAFSGCSSLIQLILFPSTPPTLVSNAIPDNMQSIYVQQSSKVAYQAATNWAAFADKIVGDNLYLSSVRFNQKNKEYINGKVDELKQYIDAKLAELISNSV